jgi:hypothetical protein
MMKIVLGLKEIATNDFAKLKKNEKHGWKKNVKNNQA